MAAGRSTHPGKTLIANSASSRNEWSCSYKKSGSTWKWASLGLPKAGLPKAAMSTYWAHRKYPNQGAVLYVSVQGLVKGKWTLWEYTGYSRVLPRGGGKTPPLTPFTGHGVKKKTVVTTPSVRKAATAWRAQVQIDWYKPTGAQTLDGVVNKTITHYTSKQVSLTHSSSCAATVKIPPPPPRLPSCSGVCGRSWGDDTSGQLGNGQTSGPFAGSPTPLAVSGLSNVTAIAGGAADGYAVSGGAVYAWGDNSSGQLGDKTTTDSNVPVKVTGISGTVSKVASGGDTAYALTTTGAIYAWGANDAGQLGTGTAGGQSTTAVKVAGLTNASAIAAGTHTAYALVAGVAYAWGDNSAGELGVGSSGNLAVPTVVTGFTGKTIDSIAAGEDDGYALLDDGTVWAWGSNSNGQLGDGQTTTDLPKTSTPVQVDVLTNVTAIAGGATNGYAVSGGAVYVWGDNSSGQLGNGTPASVQAGSTVPSTVPGLSGVVSVGAGFAGTGYAVASVPVAGSLFAFGSNTAGGLGDGATMDQHPDATSPAPVAVSGVTAVAGFGDTTAGGGGYVLTSDHKVKAWGLNTHGQLGIGVTYTSTPGVATPVTVSGLTSLKQIVGGGSNGYALAGGVVYGWGDASLGGLGSAIGYLGGSTTPVSIISSGNISSIAAGSSTAYALTTSGTVEAWGSNDDGELGPAQAGKSKNDAPSAVTSLPAVTQIAAGGGSAYGLTKTGQVYGWGSNSAGQLGSDEAGDTSATPLNIAGVSDVTQIAAGGKTAYALTKAGKVYAWGDNTYGELGDGQTPAKQAVSLVPQQVTLPGTAVAIAAGGATGYALLSNGTVESWGLNSSGQLGQHLAASTTPNPTPKTIAGLTKVTAIGAGSENGYALLSGGTVSAWGDNTSGQLGNGSDNTDSTTPVKVSNLTKVFKIGGGGSAAYALVD